MLAAATSGTSAAQKAHAIAKIIKGRDGKAAGHGASFSAVNRGVLVDVLTCMAWPPGRTASICTRRAIAIAKSGFFTERRADPVRLVPGRHHGYLVPDGPLAGDLPNQFAGPDGNLHASTLISSFNLGNGKRSIFDRDGVAIILDQRGDDYRTQPLGNAGNRIACGVLIRTAGPKAQA